MSYTRFLIWSSGCPIPWGGTIYTIFESGHYEEHSREFILNLDQWFMRKMPFTEKVYGRTMHDGRRFSSCELKKKETKKQSTKVISCP